MKKKKILFMLMFFLFLSTGCDKYEKITYSYGKITITRIDTNNKSYFYYSNPDVEKDVGYVWVEYSGFTNSWFKGYIEFDTINSKVTFYPCDNIFEGKNLDTNYLKIDEFDQDTIVYYVEGSQEPKVTYGSTPLTQLAPNQVTNISKSATSIFSNSDLCTTNFRLVKG